MLGVVTSNTDSDGRGVLAVAVTALLVVSAVAAGVSLAAVGTASAAPTQVNSCTTIDEAGTYELTTDVADEGEDPSDAQPCLRITASDVTLDGNGHTVESHAETILAGADGRLSNVTLRDVSARVTLPVGDTSTNVRFNVSNGTLANVSASGPGGGSESFPVEVNGDDNTVVDSRIGSLELTGDDNRVLDTELPDIETRPLIVDGDRNLVHNVTSEGLGEPARISGVGNRIEDGFFSVSSVGEETAIEVTDARDTVLVNNTVEANWEDGPAIVLEDATNTTFRGNSIYGNIVELAPDYYQVDFVAGDPIENLSADRLYAQQDRLMRFAHGTPDDGVTDRGSAWADESVRAAVEYGHIVEDGDGTASVTFTVADGEHVTLSLVTYSMPDSEFDVETVDQQELLNSTTEAYGPGEHTITVGLPADREYDSGEEYDE